MYLLFRAVYPENVKMVICQIRHYLLLRAFLDISAHFLRVWFPLLRRNLKNETPSRYQVLPALWKESVIILVSRAARPSWPGGPGGQETTGSGTMI